ncbi:MAG: lytic murein transglycosylase [Alphaproteobacteria bacterium]|nr:lytic murein transglycosylase [Alphaproteobacteria bacterium]MDE2111105.1 lytic murein transglycosylase [Alphaproteobacteria bacterium]MDE2494805.1 lytic murein transglycosylase [Alphaproteobacteria bacterium]
MVAAYGAPDAATAAPPAIPVPAPSPAAEDQAFAQFVQDFWPTARAAGITATTYDAAMGTISRNQHISDLNLNQPEFAKPVWDYLDTAVSAQRIADGKALLVGDADMLAKIEAKYGVPREILISIWGNESDYGRSMGNYNMFQALATLAYGGPRTDYARPQLIAALKMMQQNHYAASDMTSSWAGAFGQTQFVPTTFLNQAVDGDGDGKIDLWNSIPDALASTANVISKAGWAIGKPWGYEIALPAGFAYDSSGLDVTYPVAAWSARGVKTVAGAPLPANGEEASVYLPAGARGPAFLVFPNFKAILKYNNAASYALAVCLLADQLKGAPSVAGAWPRDEQPLNLDERLALQSALVKLGFDIGKIDGLLGNKSRAALRNWQKTHDLPADGYPTEDLLSRIALEAQQKKQ